MKLSEKYDTLQDACVDEKTTFTPAELLKELSKEFGVVAREFPIEEIYPVDDKQGFTIHLFTIFVYGKTEYKAIKKCEEIYERLVESSNVTKYSGVSKAPLETTYSVYQFRVKI